MAQAEVKHKITWPYPMQFAAQTFASRQVKANVRDWAECWLNVFIFKWNLNEAACAWSSLLCIALGLAHQLLPSILILNENLASLMRLNKFWMIIFGLSAGFWPLIRTNHFDWLLHRYIRNVIIICSQRKEHLNLIASFCMSLVLGFKRFRLNIEFNLSS